MSDDSNKNLREERWHTFTLAEQLGNIGSEVSRAANQQNRNEDLFWGAVGRGLELIDFTLSDQRWITRRSELSKMKETFCDAVLGGEEYGSNLKELQKYFDHFALLARSHIA